MDDFVAGYVAATRSSLRCDLLLASDMLHSSPNRWARTWMFLIGSQSSVRVCQARKAGTLWRSLGLDEPAADRMRAILTKGHTDGILIHK